MNTSKRPASASSRVLLSPSPWAKLGSYRAGRSSGRMPRTCSNDGTLEAAQRIAGHADSRTTKLYDPPRPEGFARGYGENSVLANPGHGEKVGDHVQQTFKYSCDIRSQLILTSQVTSVQRMSNY